MRISDFFGLNLSVTEEIAACYLFLNKANCKAFSAEIITKATPLIRILSSLDNGWAKEIATAALPESYEK